MSMKITFIDKDSYRILLSELNKFIRKTYVNSKYFCKINSVDVDFDLGQYTVVKLGWGLPDGSKWSQCEINFEGEITLQSFLARFETCIFYSENKE